MATPHILFVCGKNQWRSPTGEALYREDSRVEARSAGVSSKSRHKVSRRDIEWADLVLVMENAHKKRIQAEFRNMPTLPRIEVLNIPDEYQYMDEELVELIHSGTEYYLESMLGF